MSGHTSATGRKLSAAAAVLIATMFATTGCGFFVDQGQERFPADPDVYRDSAGVGVNVDGVGALALRNVLVVANEDGTTGNLIAAIVNDTDDDQVLHVAFGEESGTELEISVPARTTVSFGQKRGLEEPPTIEGLDAVPGSMVRIYFQAGESEGVVHEVPVLDGCLDYLTGLEPDEHGSSDECPWYVESV